MKSLEVKTITHQDCREWLLYKHYARRIPSISYSYGLFDGLHLVGVCTIGKPASPSLCVGVCGKEQSKYVYELNRLVVNDGLPNNGLSFFVGNVLKLLPPMILVSYADTSQNHHGYIYQATNWIYTGATKERTDIGIEDGSHSRHYDKNIDKSVFRKKRSSKHRYIYIIGTKRHKRIWRSLLRYDAQEYPKGENKRYDASYKPNTQIQLF